MVFLSTICSLGWSLCQTAPSSPVQPQMLLQNRRLLSVRMNSVELPDENEKSQSSASASPCPSPVNCSLYANQNVRCIIIFDWWPFAEDSKAVTDQSLRGSLQLQRTRSWRIGFKVRIHLATWWGMYKKSLILSLLQGWLQGDGDRREWPGLVAGQMSGQDGILPVQVCDQVGSQREALAGDA